MNQPPSAASPPPESLGSPAKAEILLKINRIPENPESLPHGWMRFRVTPIEIDSGSILFEVTLKPNAWGSICKVAQECHNWVAAIRCEIAGCCGSIITTKRSRVELFKLNAGDSEYEPTKLEDGNVS